MIRVCRSKHDILSADQRDERNAEKRRHGKDREEVRLIFVCSAPKDGSPIAEEELENGNLLRAIVLPEQEGILCMRHALAFVRRKNPNLSPDDFANGLRRSNWRAEPRTPDAKDWKPVEGLYTYVASTAVTLIEPQPVSQ